MTAPSGQAVLVQDPRLQWPDGLARGEGFVECLEQLGDGLAFVERGDVGLVVVGHVRDDVPRVAEVLGVMGLTLTPAGDQAGPGVLGLDAVAEPVRAGRRARLVPQRVGEPGYIERGGGMIAHPEARQVRHRDESFLHPHAVGKAPRRVGQRMQVAAGQPAYYWQIMTPGAILGIIVVIMVVAFIAALLVDVDLGHEPAEVLSIVGQVVKIGRVEIENAVRWIFRGIAGVQNYIQRLATR